MARKPDRTQSSYEIGGKFDANIPNEAGERVSGELIQEIADSVASIAYRTGVEKLPSDTYRFGGHERLVDYVEAVDASTLTAESTLNQLKTDLENIETNDTQLAADITTEQNRVTAANTNINNISNDPGAFFKTLGTETAVQLPDSSSNSTMRTLSGTTAYTVDFRSQDVGKLFSGFIIGGGAGGWYAERVGGASTNVLRGGVGGEAGLLVYFSFIQTSSMDNMVITVGSNGGGGIIPESGSNTSPTAGGNTVITIRNSSNTALAVITAQGGAVGSRPNNTVGQQPGISAYGATNNLATNAIRLARPQTFVSGSNTEALYLRAEARLPIRAIEPRQVDNSGNLIADGYISGGFGGSHLSPPRGGDSGSYSGTQPWGISGSQGSTRGDGGAGGGIFWDDSESTAYFGNGASGRGGFYHIVRI